MAAVVYGAMTQDVDTNSLFEKYTVEEIRAIEKKTRADIERKKEDLRQMVGQRYRDLIEAADTIGEMKTSAENVSLSIGHIQGYCNSFKNYSKSKTYALSDICEKPIDKKATPDPSFFIIATQMKILQDMPEKIWSALDNAYYLHATQLFLLARHINTNLQIDAQYSAHALKAFPIINTHWASLGHFKNTILQNCKNILKNSKESDETTAQCLCSLLLLEDSTPRQVFNEFLLLRTSHLSQIFSADHTESVRDQICKTVNIIVATIHQIFVVFYPSSENTENANCNLLMSTLEKVIDKGPTGAILSDDVLPKSMDKYIPKNVKEFRPSLRNHALSVTVENIQQNCNQWMEACNNSINAGLDNLLMFVNSIKGLAAIRDQVWEILNKDDKMQNWDKVCTSVLNSNINIWETLFQPKFTQRVKNIIYTQFEQVNKSTDQQIEKMLKDMDNLNDRYAAEWDVSSYVWTESSNDIPDNAAWMSTNNKTLFNSGTLMMKTCSYTPAIQNLCLKYDNKLKALLEDLANHLDPNPKEDKDSKVYSELPTSLNEIDKSEDGPFSKYQSDNDILDFTRKACQEFITNLLDHMNTIIDEMKNELCNNEKDVLITKILFIGRFGCALSELCPHLQRCMTSSIKVSNSKHKRSTSMRGRIIENEAEEWSTLKNTLNEFTSIAFMIWCDQVLNKIILRIQDSVTSQNIDQILLNTMRWDEIEIKEETEDGKSIKSTIKVPIHVSSYILNALHSICSSINCAISHSLSKSVMFSLVTRFLNELLQCFEKLTVNLDVESQKEITQLQALQHLYDLKFVYALLQNSYIDQKKDFDRRYQDVITHLESKIDPFDLDVFSPYMKSNLNRQIHRSQVLLGTLTAHNKTASLISNVKPSIPGHQEHHSILILSSNHGRFPVLHINTQTRMNNPSPLTSIIPKPQPEQQPVNTNIAVPEKSTTETASSFLGSMSTIWFTKSK